MGTTLGVLGYLEGFTSGVITRAMSKDIPVCNIWSLCGYCTINQHTGRLGTAIQDFEDIQMCNMEGSTSDGPDSLVWGLW